MDPTNGLNPWRQNSAFAGVDCFSGHLFRIHAGFAESQQAPVVQIAWWDVDVQQ